MSASREIGKRLPRCLSGVSALAPGEYCTTETIGGDVIVHVRCPDCGGVDRLGSTYKVLPHSGLVTPRWKCSTVTCPYVQRISLESWS